MTLNILTLYNINSFSAYPSTKPAQLMWFLLIVEIAYKYTDSDSDTVGWNLAYAHVYQCHLTYISLVDLACNTGTQSDSGIYTTPNATFTTTIILPSPLPPNSPGHYTNIIQIMHFLTNAPGVLYWQRWYVLYHVSLFWAGPWSQQPTACTPAHSPSLSPRTKLGSKTALILSASPL